jgi:hypothetical protein
LRLRGESQAEDETNETTLRRGHSHFEYSFSVLGAEKQIRLTSACLIRYERSES